MPPKTASKAPTAVTRSLGHVVVTGGCGFLGSHIVKLLLSRSATSKITALDLKPSQTPLKDVNYMFGDITDYDGMVQLLGELKPDAIIHTASPPGELGNEEVFRKVNVEGTKTLVRAAQETGVKAFVYTSSASVISNVKDNLVYADETYPLILGKQQTEYYTLTKAQAEVHVLASNRASSHPKFLTAAIRPSAIFGEGDAQLIPGTLSAYYKGQTNIQVGDNLNLFDFTHVVNVAHAHHLACAALLATYEREAGGSGPPLDYEKVDGEAFFITNDTPCYFYDFARLCWASAGDKVTPPNKVWTISKDFGSVIATILLVLSYLLMPFNNGTRVEPSLTPTRVKYVCMTRYFNIDKAKHRLGYRPIVKLEDGVRSAVKYAIENGMVAGMPENLKVKKQQ